MTLLLALCAPSFAAELVVPDDHATVQDAIDAAAATGDVIIVTEDLDGTMRINGKDLVINGVGMATDLLR